MVFKWLIEANIDWLAYGSASTWDTSQDHLIISRINIFLDIRSGSQI